jgi:hypothetical protein
VNWCASLQNNKEIPIKNNKKGYSSIALNKPPQNRLQTMRCILQVDVWNYAGAPPIGTQHEQARMVGPSQ